MQVFFLVRISKVPVILFYWKLANRLGVLCCPKCWRLHLLCVHWDGNLAKLFGAQYPNKSNMWVVQCLLSGHVRHSSLRCIEHDFRLFFSVYEYELTVLISSFSLTAIIVLSCSSSCCDTASLSPIRRQNQSTMWPITAIFVVQFMTEVLGPTAVNPSPVFIPAIIVLLHYHRPPTTTMQLCCAHNVALRACDTVQIYLRTFLSYQCIYVESQTLYITCIT